MRVLTRYLVARFLGLFAAFLVAALLSVAIVEMLLNLDDVVKVQEGPGGVLTYFRLRILAYYLRDLVPTAAFAAAFTSLALAANWLETTAIQAGGISPQRATLPVLATAAVLALIQLGLSETWLLRANREWKTRSSRGVAELDYRRGSFWYQQGRTIYNLSGADPATRTLHNVRVFQRDARGRLLRSIRAARVRVEDDHRWRFERATIRHFDPRRIGVAPRVEELEAVIFEILADSEAALLGADAALLPLAKLRAHIDSLSGESVGSGRLGAVLHRRLCDPLLLFGLVLLAIPLAFRVERERALGRPALAATLTLAAFLVSRNVGTTLAEQEIVPAAAGVWAVVGAFTAWGAWRFARLPM